MQDMLRADGAAQWLYDKVEQDKMQENDAIQEFLSAVQPLDDTYKANQDKLTATLSQLQGREGELKGKTILSYDAAQRQELLQQVVEAHETYRKVLEAVREGQNFYISMYDPVKNHQLRCQDFKTARELMAQDAEDEKRRKAEEEAAATAAAAKAKAASDQLEADARKRLAEERAREEADMALARRLADSGAMSVVRQPRVPPPQPDAVQVPPAAAQDQLATDAAIAQAMGGGAGTRHRPPPLHPRPPPPDTSADEALARALAAEGGTPTAASAPAVADKCLNCDRPPARGYQHCCRGCALRTGCECGDADLARQLASMASPTAASAPPGAAPRLSWGVDAAPPPYVPPPPPPAQQPPPPPPPYVSQQPPPPPPPYVQQPAPPPRPKLPDFWEEKTDPHTGKTFYIDHTTRTTHWELPK